MSLITHLKNLSEYNTLLAAKKDKLVIVSDPLQLARRIVRLTNLSLD